MADNHVTNIASAENKALLDAAEKFGAVSLLTLDTDDETVPDLVEVATVPTGRKLESVKRFLDEYRTRPERKAGTSELTTIASFVDQVNRSKDADSVIFADVANADAAKLIAVFDYNKGGPEGEPRFGRHRAVYRFPVSDEWIAWTKRPIENIDQATFAEFLETRIMDIIDSAVAGPETRKNIDAFCRQLGIGLASPQRMMELSRGLTVHAEHKVHQSIAIGSGEQQIAFTEDHKDQSGAPLKVPGGFAIAIPVFKAGAAYPIPVRLRYRVVGGQVRWTLQPQRLEVVWDDAVKEAVNAVTTKTSLVTLYGTPET